MVPRDPLEPCPQVSAHAFPKLFCPFCFQTMDLCAGSTVEELREVHLRPGCWALSTGRMKVMEVVWWTGRLGQFWPAKAEPAQQADF